jgi:uncharacterized protein YdcH (DUF465 family)
MFEHRQDQLNELLKSSDEFRAIYNRHQELDKQVTAAEDGSHPMDDLTLNQLKKKKLQAKDKLARLMSAGNA